MVPGPLGEIWRELRMCACTRARAHTHTHTHTLNVETSSSGVRVRQPKFRSQLCHLQVAWLWTSVWPLPVSFSIKC